MTKIGCTAGVILSLLTRQMLTAAPPEHSVSPSRQFIIYGATGMQRALVSQLAEQTKATLLKLLHESDKWATPIVVYLQTSQANVPELPPAALRFSQTGFGLKLQLDLTLASDGDAVLAERELLRAILLEIVYRRNTAIAPGTKYVEPPDWLIEGVLALTPGRDRQPLIEALAPSPEVSSLGQFLQQRPALLEASGRLRYRAYALAFVQLLVENPDGRSQLAGYIGNLSRTSNDPLEDLRAQFPMLRGDPERLWQLCVRRLSSTSSYQLLTFAETENRLRQLLILKLDENGQSSKTELSDLLQRKISPPEVVALRQVNQELILLGAQAHPLLRPVVREYQRITALAATGKRHRLSQRLVRVKTTHTKLVARMEDVDDYMNWFEATQIDSSSGAFADYLKAARDGSSGKIRRRDALSVYLDSLETQL